MEAGKLVQWMEMVTDPDRAKGPYCKRSTMMRLKIVMLMRLRHPDSLVVSNSVDESLE